MKTNARLGYILLGTMMVSLAAAGAFAQPHGRGCGHNFGPGMGMEDEMCPGHGPGRDFADMDLSDEQKQKLAEHRKANQKTMIALKAELQTIMVDLHDEADNESPDQAKIDRLAKQAGDLHGKLLAARIEKRMFLRRLLTPEQKKQWKEKIRQAPRRGPGHGQPGSGMHHGGPAPDPAE